MKASKILKKKAKAIYKVDIGKKICHNKTVIYKSVFCTPIFPIRFFFATVVGCIETP